MSVCKKIRKPYFLIDLKQIERNYSDFKNAIDDNNRNDIIAYSIKANYDSNIIRVLDIAGAYFEVCSQFELDILKGYGISMNKIIINGFIDSKEALLKYISGGALVIIESNYQVEWLKNIDYTINIGIRINLDYIKTDNKMFYSTKSRFGFDINNNKIQDLVLNKYINIKCIHCHFSGNTREPGIYSSIVKELCNIVDKFHLDSIDMLDIGGGYKIDSNFWTFNDYLNTIITTLKKCNKEHMKLIFEPGNSLVRNSCSYYVTVIDTKEINKINYVIVNGSILHLAKRTYNISHYKHNNMNKTVLSNQIVVGCTCKESDLICEFTNHNKICVGDEIIIDNVGAYTINEISGFLLGNPDIKYKR